MERRKIASEDDVSANFQCRSKFGGLWAAAEARMECLATKSWRGS